MKKIKEIIQNKEFKILIYYIVIAILLIAILFFWNTPSAGNMPTKTDFSTLLTYAVDNVGYGFISMICFMPIIIKIPFSTLIVIIQIFAIISKKNKRKLNYITSILNLVISIIALLVSFIEIIGIFISTYFNTLITLTMIIQVILIVDIIATILIISSNRKKIEQKLDLYDIEK